MTKASVWSLHQLECESTDLMFSLKSCSLSSRAFSRCKSRVEQSLLCHGSSRVRDGAHTSSQVGEESASSFAHLASMGLHRNSLIPSLTDC